MVASLRVKKNLEGIFLEGENGAETAPPERAAGAIRRRKSATAAIEIDDRELLSIE
jgi:hypothetical protein